MIGVDNVSNGLSALIPVWTLCLQSNYLLRHCCDEEQVMSGSGKTRGRMQLTAKAIEAFKPDVEPYRWSDTRASGLAIRVATSGEKTWDCFYRVKGSPKVKRLSLGRYDDPGASLEEARARANELTSAARQGVDLIAQELEAREAKARSMTLGKLVELYVSRQVAGRLRSAADVERTLRRVLSPLAAMHAADIKRRDLAPLLEAIAARGRERAAGNAKQLIGGMFRWAEKQDIVSADPTKGLPTYDLGTPRDRVLDEDELRLFWAWLPALPLADADALRVQLHTGARIGEIAGMTAKAVDRDKWLWTLPASDSKNGKSRVTPLVGLARTIIAARIDDAGDGPLFVSEAGAALTSNSIGTTLYNRRDKLPIAVVRTHDLRRTAASMMYAIRIARDTIGAIVGHGSDDGDRGSRTLIRHYLKSDLIERKTRALEEWDARLKAIIANEPQPNVVPLRGGQRSRGSLSYKIV
jgi:integrase